MHDSLQLLIATCDRPMPHRECPVIQALGGVPNGSTVANAGAATT